MIKDRIAEMSDSAAVRALVNYHDRFMAKEPSLASRLHQELGVAIGREELSRKWIDTNFESVSAVQGEAARFALSILSSSDERENIEAIVADVESNASGYAFDPVTLSIGGVIAIGLVLAARVKSIGDAEFYQGVPKEIGSVLDKLLRLL